MSEGQLTKPELVELNPIGDREESTIFSTNQSNHDSKALFVHTKIATTKKRTLYASGMAFVVLGILVTSAAMISKIFGSREMLEVASDMADGYIEEYKWGLSEAISLTLSCPSTVLSSIEYLRAMNRFDLLNNTHVKKFAPLAYGLMAAEDCVNAGAFISRCDSECHALSMIKFGNGIRLMGVAPLKNETSGSSYKGIFRISSLSAEETGEWFDQWQNGNKTPDAVAPVSDNTVAPWGYFELLDMKKDERRWGPIFQVGGSTNLDIKSATLTMGLALPLFNSTGQQYGFLQTDLSLTFMTDLLYEAVQNLTRSCAANANISRVFVVEQITGRLVGSGVGMDYFVNTETGSAIHAVLAIESNDLIERNVAIALKDQFLAANPNYTNLNADVGLSEPYIVSLSRLRGSSVLNLDWVVVIAVPRSQFFAKYKNSQTLLNSITGSSVLATLLAVMILVWVFYQFVRRIETLRDRLVDANFSLVKTSELAQAANAAKSQFLAVMNHEMRTPLTSIIGVIEFLKCQDLGDEVAKMVGLAHNSAEMLLKLVNDVLDFSKAEAGKVDFEYVSFDLAARVTQTMDIIQPIANLRHVKTTFQVAPDVPLRLVGDKNRIQQVLLNLSSNAIKHAGKGGSVNVCVEVISRTDSTCHIRFKVKDSGDGISSDEQERLFTPFTQLRRHADSSGTGIGLALSKDLVAGMGGEIGVESEVGRGSTFWFTLPFVMDEKVPAPSTAELVLDTPLKCRAPNLRVLVVDDNPMVLKVVSALVSSLGYPCETAGSGETALKLYRERSSEFGLILMDYHMPGLDGRETTKEIRKIEESAGSRRVPVVALTAAATSEIREKCLESGMNGFESKPITMKKMKKTFAEFFDE